MARFELLLAACLVASCVASEPVYVSLDEIQSDLIFVLTGDQDQNVLRLQNEFVRQSEEYQNRPLVEFTIKPKSETAYIIGIDLDNLIAQRPNIDLSRLQETQVVFRDDNTQERRDFASEKFPDTTQLFQLSEDAGSFRPASEEVKAKTLNRLYLRTPINLEYCRNKTQETLQPFPRAHDEKCSKNYQHLFSVDENRFIAAGWNSAHLYHTKKTVDCRNFERDETSEHKVQFTGPGGRIAVAPRATTRGEFLIAAVTSLFADEEARKFDNPTSFLIEVANLGPDGFEDTLKSYEIQTTEIMNKIAQRCESPGLSTQPQSNSIIIDYENTITVLLENGSLLILEEGQEEFRHDAICDYTQYATDWLIDFAHMNVRPDTLNDYFIGTDSTDGFGYVFNVRNPIDDPIKAYAQPVRPLDLVDSVFDSHANSPGFMIVANGTSLVDGFKDKEALILEPESKQPSFTEWSAIYPQRIDECLNNGRFRELDRIAVDEKAVYVLPECNAIARIRRKDRCAQIIKTPEHAYFSRELTEMNAILVHQDTLFVAGEDGLLLTISLKDIDLN